MWVQSLGWEDPMEEGMATHSSILAWKIPMDREAWQVTYNPWGRRVRHDRTTVTHLVKLRSQEFVRIKRVSISEPA